MEIDQFIQIVRENIPETLALVISIISMLVTIILGRKEKPNIMPYGQNVQGNHLALDFFNTSPFNIHNLTILLNGFNNRLQEIDGINFADKFLFSVGEKTKFNYGFLLGEYAKEKFYLRVRLKGSYRSRFPIFSKRTHEQLLWYSFTPIRKEDDKISIKISVTHKDEIEKLDKQHGNKLKEYENNIDAKFYLPD